MLTYMAMQISKIISDVVSSKLGVPSDRFYLSVSFCNALSQPITHSLSEQPFHKRRFQLARLKKASGANLCLHVGIPSFVACGPQPASAEAGATMLATDMDYEHRHCVNLQEA